jgi:hypothetical protein
MRKNTISLAQLTHQILLEQKIQLLFENAAAMASGIQNKVVAFGKEMQAAGEDPTDMEAQAALLMAAL